MTSGQRNFRAVWASNFITSAGMMAFIPMLPLYLRDLGVQDPGSVRIWAGVLTAAAPFPAAFMGPVWGALGDRVGRKLMMLRANAAIVLFVGLMAAVGGPWQLLALRLGQGVFSGFIAPAMTLVSVSAPAELQSRVAAQLQTAVLAGGMLGPLLGGVVADALGFRAVFITTAGFSLVALLLTAVLVREPAGRQLVVGGMQPLELLQGAFRDGLAFLRMPVLRGVLVAAFVVRFGSRLVEPVLVLWVETLEGFAPDKLTTATGLIVGAQAVALLLFAPWWGRFADRHGHRRLFCVSAAGASALYLAQLFATHVVPMFLLRFGSGAFLAGIVPAAFGAAARHSQPSQRGGAYGVTFSSVILAQAIAPVCGGLLAAAVGLESLFVVAAVLMAGAAWMQRAGRSRAGTVAPGVEPAAPAVEPGPPSGGARPPATRR